MAVAAKKHYAVRAGAGRNIAASALPESSRKRVLSRLGLSRLGLSRLGLSRLGKSTGRQPCLEIPVGASVPGKGRHGCHGDS